MIRKAAASDAGTVLELVRAYYQYDGIDFDEQKVRPALERLLAAPDLGFVHLVETDGRIVGYAMATWGYDVEFGGRFALLTDLYVMRDFWGAGFGRSLVAAVEQAAKEGGASALEGQVMRGNERARSFYHEWGFRFPDRLLMSRRL
ncbi:GNAT family N-acetyltransferase [Vulgatibacter sp.]|uniref:GNAT family N-acetyltransferase n=1 Tax=Vulgatibacter sp. TaxID=1971226 RepID=UPI003564414A